MLQSLISSMTVGKFIRPEGVETINLTISCQWYKYYFEAPDLSSIIQAHRYHHEVLPVQSGNCQYRCRGR
jgi:hypothetical protein